METRATGGGDRSASPVFVPVANSTYAGYYESAVEKFPSGLDRPVKL
jgi:hypothetical protein